MFNYTLIIPHYRSVDTLHRLLLSIPDRNDIQILVIDDNSSLDEDEFKRLPLFAFAEFSIIFLMKNEGAGGARNKGLKTAKGKWLIFADSDDYFVENAFSIFDKYNNEDYDIVYFKSESICLGGDIVSDRSNYYNQLIDSFSPEDVKSVNKLRYNHGVPWCKMIKKNLVIFNNIQFDAIMYSNDVMFSTKIGYYAEKIAAVNSIVYYVTTNVGSLTSQKSKESLLCRYETALRQNKFLRDRELAKYQKSIMFYLRLSLNYGVSTLLFFIRLGIKYRANFTIGMLHWHEYITTKIKSKCLF